MLTKLRFPSEREKARFVNMYLVSSNKMRPDVKESLPTYTPTRRDPDNRLSPDCVGRGMSNL